MTTLEIKDLHVSVAPDGKRPEETEPRSRSCAASTSL